MWVDNLSETSQKKNLGNVYISYADFVSFILFFSTTQRLRNFSCVYYGQIQLLKAHICVSSTAVKRSSYVKAELT